MIEFKKDEDVTVVGELTKQPFVRQNNYFIEVRIKELNNRKINPETIILSIDYNQKRQLININEGDVLFIKCNCRSTDDKSFYSKQTNFAFMTEFKLLNRKGIDKDFVKNCISELIYGRKY